MTVCVPAYNAADFISETLRSLQAQQFKNFLVKVAVEPSDDGTLEVCREFLSDPRFEILSNQSVLGWAENISRLLRDISTPFFSVLPHDDLYHPSYISSLLSALREHPGASVAYADSSHFGSVSHIKRLDIHNGPVSERLLSFFLAGAEAIPWRGVTRACVIDNALGFPDNRFGGFAVECEWTLHLIVQGQAIRVRQPLYLKRHFGGQRKTVSWQWMNTFEKKKLLEALEYHRKRMKTVFVDLELPEYIGPYVELAFEVAMLRRHTRFCRGRISFSERQKARVRRIRKALHTLDGEWANKIRSRLDLSCSINAMVDNDSHEVERYARSAVKADERNWEAQIHLARVLACSGKSAAAQRHAIKAACLEPDGEGIAAMLNADKNSLR